MKALKIIGLSLLILILLISIGIYALVHYVDPNKFKKNIENIAYQETGHHLHIRGNISWSFFPWIGFRVQDVMVENALGFRDVPLATLNEADVTVKLFPLFAGEVEMNNVTCDGLTLNLMRNAQGITNWSDIVSHNPSPAAPDSNTASSSTAPSGLMLSINQFTVINSTINWQDDLKHQNVTLNNIYINGTNVGTEQVFPLSVSFELATKPFIQPVMVSLQGNVNVDSQFQSIGINSLDAKIGQAELAGNIAINLGHPNMSFQGDLQLKTLNVPTFLSTTTIQLPAMQNSDALNKVSFNIAFNGNNNSIDIKPLTISIDKTAFTGNANISDFAHPNVNITLSTDKFNVDNYMPAPVVVAATTSSSASATPSTTTATATPSAAPLNLPTDMLRNLQLNVSLSIGHLTALKLNLSNVALTLTDNNGLLALSPASASLYEGTAKINGTLDVRNTTPQFSLNVALANVQSEPLLNDMTGKDFLAGTANFTMNVQTSANTKAELISHLNGNGTFSLSNGVIKGVNVDYLLAQAKSLINKTAAPAATSDNTTPFGQLTGTFTVAQGVVSNNDLLVNNPNFTVNGQGKADLNQLTLDYKLTISSSQLQGYKIPINVRGVLSSPSVTLDTQSILIQILNQEKNQLVSKAIPQLLANASPQVQQAANAALGSLLGQ